jgi:Family of unknown function (DUF6520)
MNKTKIFFAVSALVLAIAGSLSSKATSAKFAVTTWYTNGTTTCIKYTALNCSGGINPCRTALNVKTLRTSQNSGVNCANKLKKHV